MGIPPGVLTGIYLAEFGNNKFGRTIRFLNDVLTEFPSIVVGILVAALLVVATHQYSPIAGAIALSIITLPIVARTTEESIKTVPNSIRDAAMALGIRRWRTTISVVLSTARSSKHRRQTRNAGTIRLKQVKNMTLGLLEELKPENKPLSATLQQMERYKILTENLHAWFGSNHVLKDISIKIRENEATAIIGPSGCGKSTLIRCLNR